MNMLVFRENTQIIEERDVLVHLLSFVRTTKPAAELADSLLDSFGSLKSVLESRPESLAAIPGIGKKAADLLSSFIPMVRIWQRITLESPSHISNSVQAESFCKTLLSGLRNEEFWVISLSAHCNVLGKRRVSTGSLDQVNCYPRIIVETALNHNAHSIILCHNHPGGACVPSKEDIQSTLMIQRVLRDIGILVLDHIIVAGDHTYSMAHHGDISHC